MTNFDEPVCTERRCPTTRVGLAKATMRATAVAVGLSALLGCHEGLDEAVPLPALDEAYFRCRVQPVLTKTCSMFICHGDGRRFFRVFARNRLRLEGSEAERNSFLREDERRTNYNAARAFVDPERPDESLLLLKPRDQAIGGYYHGGALEYGRGDVFTADDDPDYQTLLSWVRGAREEEQECIEPGSDL